jgi:hypothetical protein
MNKTRKPIVRIPEAKWHRIRDDWLSSLDMPKVIAARHGIHHRTLLERAAKKNWPQRGSMADDPATVARLLYIDLTAELRDSLRSLRDPASEAPASATQRAPLIRAHRRALIALLDARKPATGGAAPANPTDFPALDLAAAREDILARLARMDAAP